MKKRVMAIVMICVLMVGGNATVVSAHGHAKQTKKATVCSIKNCKKTSTHKHSGKSYSPHKNGDGHKYHATLCTMENCKKTAVHKHSSKYYKPHKNNDGHSYHKNHKSGSSHKNGHH